MDLRSYFAKDTLANIAKGRYNREKVEDMFRKAMYGAANEAERFAFEFAILTALQTLHYDFGTVLKSIKEFLSEPFTAAVGDTNYSYKWSAKVGEWKK